MFKNRGWDLVLVVCLAGCGGGGERPWQPADPQTIAPALDHTVAGDIFEDTRFLYENGQVQQGLLPEVVDRMRVSVLRGRVVDEAGAGLPGVEISLLNHPELGWTLSREDGRYDLVVNGGGVLTLLFQADGYFTAQRTVGVPWRDYVYVGDVAPGGKAHRGDVC